MHHFVFEFSNLLAKRYPFTILMFIMSSESNDIYNRKTYHFILKDSIYRHDRYDLWLMYCADLITKHNMTKVTSENVESFTF